jgi:hypothetical protein
MISEGEPLRTAEGPSKLDEAKETIQSAADTVKGPPSASERRLMLVGARARHWTAWRIGPERRHCTHWRSHSWLVWCLVGADSIAATRHLRRAVG